MPGGSCMAVVRPALITDIAVLLIVTNGIWLSAEQIPVHHTEGVAFAFLVLRNLDGEALAYGDWKQIVRPDGLVVDDLQFQFRDGSSYQEITKFTQRGKFHLVSDQVKQRGPSFKQEGESWIDAETGQVMVRFVENGDIKTTNSHLDLPNDVSNGLLFALLKNASPTTETTVSFVAVSRKPRLVKWNISPGPEKTIKVGSISQKVQHYIVRTAIRGVAGIVAPLVGKDPPDIHVWLVKSDAPTFAEFEGPLSEGNPVWRMELAAPEPDSRVGADK